MRCYSRHAILVATVCALVVTFAGLAQASHFGFGTLDWERTEDNTITVDITLGLNLDWGGNYYYSNDPPAEGDYVESNLAYMICHPKECGENPDQSDFLMHYRRWINSNYYHSPYNCAYAYPECPPEDSCSNSEKEYRLKSTTTGTQYERVCPPESSCTDAEKEMRPELYNGSPVYAEQFFTLNKLEIRKLYEAEADRFFLVTQQIELEIPDVSKGSDGWNARNADWQCNFVSWARIDELLEENDGSANPFKMDTVIPAGVLQSPKAVGFAREYMAVGHEWTFTIPVDKVPGTTLRYEVAPQGRTTGSYYDIPLYGSGLTTALPGTYSTSDDIPPMDISRLADEGVLSWFIPSTDSNGDDIFSSSDFPLQFAVQIWIIDSNEVVIPYDFIIVADLLCA